ncbi:hypothetical protein DICPUDRAFT_75462 [Dictyostelium purpureum]|uniref:CHCH domain-containing protein n=1 Tax=Dictyostelium purpureum TaxID=5786 RepID=F0ZAQ7_DICPU|nr:uncharacterized protein DICPUDRAFT_75462 [Dictyostelium purpureum]EGC38929.1 hypothetical protein DICPUDRAFT_75462 [Dictyostelium purpureum]|eukprot:XP_003284494.1 hypothetical protein DICPUDRAFT_75462 [Dictyostelium purpureum]
MSNNTNQNKNQNNEKPLGDMTKEERTSYSIKRAPDYTGKEDAVLNVSREKCWKSRDEYFECLDKNNDNESKCKEFYDKFSDSCLKSWKEYFIKKRIADINKQNFLNRSE